MGCGEAVTLRVPTLFLMAGAVAALTADAVAYLALIVTGHATEANPLVAAAPPALALSLKATLIVYLVALTALGSRRSLHVVLLVAVVAGSLGAATTFGAVR
jgi:hypothetical protein